MVRRIALALPCLVLLTVTCWPVHAKEDEQGPKIEFIPFGPPETGYPFADFRASLSDIQELSVRAQDDKGRVIAAFDMTPGVVLVYRVERDASEGEGRWFERTQGCASVMNERLSRGGHIGFGNDEGRSIATERGAEGLGAPGVQHFANLGRGLFPFFGRSLTGQ